MTDTPGDARGEHVRAWEVMPWVVNGRASARQRRLLDAHLRDCAACRLELARERALHAALAADAPHAPVDADVGLQRLLARIDAVPEGVPAAASQLPRPRDLRDRATALNLWLAVAVVVEALALAALGLGLGPRPEAAPGYVTLSEPAARQGATIRIVPDPGMRLADLAQLLRELNLQVVSGPNSLGAYELAPLSQGPSQAQQLDTLRAAPALRLVEPIADPRARP